MTKRKTAALADDELVGFTAAPSKKQSEKLSALGRELYEVDTAIADLEAQLAQRKERRKKLAMEELPEYMKSIGQNVVGLAEFGVQLSLEPYYHANISADWPEEDKQRAFDYLEARGDGDLIKLNLTYAFRRGQLAEARWLRTAVELVRLAQAQCGVEEEFSLPEPSLRTEVHYMTLTAWLREQVEAGREVDLDILKATVGQVVKIKHQKKGK